MIQHCIKLRTVPNPLLNLYKSTRTRLQSTDEYQGDGHRLLTPKFRPGGSLNFTWEEKIITFNTHLTMRFRRAVQPFFSVYITTYRYKVFCSVYYEWLYNKRMALASSKRDISVLCKLNKETKIKSNQETVENIFLLQKRNKTMHKSYHNSWKRLSDKNTSKY